MKFKVEVVGQPERQDLRQGLAARRGRAGGMDASRPIDPQPNYEGAAGIYANSTMAPLYYDNVKVYR